MIYLTYLTKRAKFDTLLGGKGRETMSYLPWNQRFFSSTRGHILVLLRRASQTVDELAQALTLTDNAVRAHLATLERDGFVRQRGVRRGSSKPASVYELAPDAEYLFPKSYGQILNELLGILDERMSADELGGTLRMVGRRIAARWNIPPGELGVRLEAAVGVLNELGGMAELEQEVEQGTSQNSYCIQSYSCPLAAIVPGHPGVCGLAETLLSELVGVPVQEQCEYGEQLRCRFVVPAH
jgi:predicted ArsR family transcriptional regulator